MGDHSSPDSPGYVALIRGILERFHPGLNLRLISAGGPGQTVAGFASQAMRELLTSSRPDWVSVALGLRDAAGEPELMGQVLEYRQRLEATADAESDASIGPEHHEGRRRGQENGTLPQPTRPSSEQWQHTERFGDTLGRGVEALRAASIGVILHTPVFVGTDPQHPLNHAARAYAKVVRATAAANSAVLVDDLEAFRGVLDRATSYKQRVELANLEGRTNAQGDALLARTFLSKFGLLPQPGGRPRS
jgi:hypothetical protein